MACLISIKSKILSTGKRLTLSAEHLLQNDCLVKAWSHRANEQVMDEK